MRNVLQVHLHGKPCSSLSLFQKKKKKKVKSERLKSRLFPSVSLPNNRRSETPSLRRRSCAAGTWVCLCGADLCRSIQSARMTSAVFSGERRADCEAALLAQPGFSAGHRNRRRQHSASSFDDRAVFRTAAPACCDGPPIKVASDRR